MLQPRRPGVADQAIFPLPFPTRHGQRRTPLGIGAHTLVCIWVAFLNTAYAGPGREHFCPWQSSHPQRRCLASLHRRASDFLAELGNGKIGGESNLYEFLRVDRSGYGERGGVLPLGARCGVPARAAEVDTAGVLDGTRPDLAAMARDPMRVLHDPPRFEYPPPVPHAHLDRSYGEYVDKAVQAGLFQLLPRGDLPQVSGVDIVSGGFAVGKDKTEDRPITPSSIPTRWLIRRSWPR